MNRIVARNGGYYRQRIVPGNPVELPSRESIGISTTVVIGDNGSSRPGLGFDTELSFRLNLVEPSKFLTLRLRFVDMVRSIVSATPVVLPLPSGYLTRGVIGLVLLVGLIKGYSTYLGSFAA